MSDGRAVCPVIFRIVTRSVFAECVRESVVGSVTGKKNDTFLEKKTRHAFRGTFVGTLSVYHVS